MNTEPQLPEPRIDLAVPEKRLIEIPVVTNPKKHTWIFDIPYPTLKDIMRLSWRQLRPLVLMIGSVLTGAGFLPEGVSTTIVENAETAVAAVLGIWSATAFLRNRNDAKVGQ